MSLQIPCGSLPLTATLLQVPAVVAETLQDLQAPAQSVAQQTPCLQKVDLHSLPSAQVRPGSLSPHDPALQTAGGEQSALAVQAALQTLAPQR